PATETIRPSALRRHRSRRVALVVVVGLLAAALVAGLLLLGRSGTGANGPPSPRPSATAVATVAQAAAALAHDVADGLAAGDVSPSAAAQIAARTAEAISASRQGDVPHALDVLGHLQDQVTAMAGKGDIGPTRAAAIERD